MSGKKKQAKHTGSLSARAGKAVPLQDGAAVFLPKLPAAVFSGPVIVDFTFMASHGLLEAHSRGLRDHQALPRHPAERAWAQPLPPPALPKSVPFHMKGPVDLAVRSTKIAWLKESKRADVTGEDISDERLNQLYKQGRRYYSRRASDPEVRALNLPTLPFG